MAKGISAEHVEIVKQIAYASGREDASKEAIDEIYKHAGKEAIDGTPIDSETLRLIVEHIEESIRG